MGVVFASDVLQIAYKKLGFSALCLKPLDPYRLIDRIDAALIASGQTPLFMMRVNG